MIVGGMSSGEGQDEKEAEYGLTTVGGGDENVNDHRKYGFLARHRAICVNGNPHPDPGLVFSQYSSGARARECHLRPYG